MPGIETKSWLSNWEVLGPRGGKQLLWAILEAAWEQEEPWSPRCLAFLFFFPVWASLAGTLSFAAPPRPPSGFVLSSIEFREHAWAPVSQQALLWLSPGPIFRLSVTSSSSLFFSLHFIDHLHGFVPKLWQWYGNQSAWLSLFFLVFPR